MRIFASAILASTLLVTNAFAGNTAGPLPAGKPAGVKQAQTSDNTILYVLGGAVVIGGIALIASSNGGDGNNNAPGGGGTGGTSGSSP